MQVLASQSHFVAIRNAELAVQPLFWHVNYIKIEGHVALLSGPTVYSLYCGPYYLPATLEIQTELFLGISQNYGNHENRGGGRWGRGRGRGRGGRGRSGRGRSGRGGHPPGLSGREIGMWHKKRTQEKNAKYEREQVDFLKFIFVPIHV